MVELNMTVESICTEDIDSIMHIIDKYIGIKMVSLYTISDFIICHCF